MYYNVHQFLSELSSESLNGQDMQHARRCEGITRIVMKEIRADGVGCIWLSLKCLLFSV